MRALSIAATGMTAQQTNVEVIANNIANVNTTGYKRARAEFADLLYQTERAAGGQGRNADAMIPEGLSVGLGVRPVAVRNLHIQGSFKSTGNKFDLALNGRGYFQVQGANGETFHTRAGSFNKNAQGLLVNTDGLPLVPAISIPAAATDVTVSDTGQVSARIGASGQLQNVGQITIANFANESGLEPMGGNLFRETPASGSPTVTEPGEPGAATIQQGYLEGSNVDPMKEITELISAQRAYEMNSKVIQAADEMYSLVTKGMR
jgi:flagellar basal-body rod protein FlgG